MQTKVDRRTFLTRAAAAGGGLASIGAIERLVARDALGAGRPASAARQRWFTTSTGAGSCRIS